LEEAVERAGRGLIDADLGGGLIKQRLARAGGGRSGGYRMVLALRMPDRAVFLYGFAKSEPENIGVDELQSLRDIAAAWLAADLEQVMRSVAAGVLVEVPYDDKSARSLGAGDPGDGQGPASGRRDG
jgi:hypothetical protein